MENKQSINYNGIGLKERIEWIDIAKGLGIIFMVLGHGLVGERALYFICSFNMPLFFLIDGMFCKDFILFSPEHKNYIKKTFVRLIIPYFMTCILMVLFSLVMNLLRNNQANLLPDVKNWIVASLYGQGINSNEKFPMIGAIWFLWAMFWGKVIFSFINGNKYCIPIVIALFAIGYLTSRIFYLPLSIQSGLTSIIFIWCGRKIKESCCLDKNRICLFFTASLLWAVMVFLNDGGGFGIVNNSYNSIASNVISGICGSIIIFLISQKLEKFNALYFLKYIGRYSLIFLCLHILDLNIFRWFQIEKFIFSIVHLEDYRLSVRFILRMLMYFSGCWIILHSPLRRIYTGEWKKSY